MTPGITTVGGGGHTEERAYCRSIEVFKAIKADLAARVASGEMKKAKADTIWTTFFKTDLLCREAMKKAHAVGAKKSDLPGVHGKGTVEKAEEDQELIEPDDPSLNDSSGGYKIIVGGYTLRSSATSYELATGGLYGLDGASVGQPFAIARTPYVSGGYDDSDLYMFEYGAVRNNTPSGQQFGDFNIWQFDDDITRFRLSAFIHAGPVRHGRPPPRQRAGRSGSPLCRAMSPANGSRRSLLAPPHGGNSARTPRGGTARSGLRPSSVANRTSMHSSGPQAPSSIGATPISLVRHAWTSTTSGSTIFGA